MQLPLPSGAEADRGELFRNTGENLKNNILNTLQLNGDDDLAANYKAASNNWRDKVLPYYQVPGVKTVLKDKFNCKINSSINKNLDYLIVGKNPGSKLKKAQNINQKQDHQIIILTEQDFQQMLQSY